MQTKTQMFACDACGLDVIWNQTREGKTYLAERVIWEGDQGGSKVLFPSHRCAATDEQKESARIAREAVKAAKQAVRDSKFFADAGTKFEIEAEIITVKVYKNEFGYGTIIEFTSGDYVFKWFASGDQSEKFEVGQVATIKGTVKGQEEKFGKISTLVTRCKIAA